MNETFQKGVSQKTLEIFQKTGVTKAEFCRKLLIPGSYLTALQNEKFWAKIPAWVWFLFQEVTNRKIEFGKSGEIIHVCDGYTVEELHESCRQKAEEFALREKGVTSEEATVNVKGTVIPRSTDITEEGIGSMKMGTIPDGHGGQKFATEEDLNEVISHMIDMADIIADVRKEELHRIIKLKRNLIRCQTKKQ